MNAVVVEGPQRSTADPPRSTRRLASLVRRNRRAVVGLVLVIPSLLVFALLIGYPVGYAIHLSFVDYNLFDRSEKFVGIANYSHLLHDPTFRSALLNGIVWTAGSLIGELGLGLVAAVLINRAHPAMVWVRLVLLMPYVVPVVAIALIWRWMLDGKFGVLSHWLQQLHVIPVSQSPLALPTGAMIAVIVINVWRGFPFAMLIYWAALQGIDAEQYEAAGVDGAGRLKQFRYVTLPNLKGATLTLFALRGIWTFTYFDLIWLVTKGGPAQATNIVPTYIYQVALGSFQFSYAATITVATGVMLVALIAIVQMVRYRRRIVSSLANVVRRGTSAARSR